MYLFEVDEDEVDFQLPHDIITITRHGYNDYSIYYHNENRLIRGTATDLLYAVTDNNLDAVKEFAMQNISKKDNKLTITHGFVLVETPWLSLDGSNCLDDAKALKHWGIKTTVSFCLKVLECI